MLLAAALAECRDELEADMQEVYGLDLCRMGETYSTAHAARLASQLAENSRTKRALRGDEPWSDEVLLASIANSLRALPAQLSGRRDALKKVKQFGPRTDGGARRMRGLVLPARDLLQKLGVKGGESPWPTPRSEPHT